MRALFVTAVLGLLSPLSAFASYSLSGFNIQEYSDYYLYYQDSHDYGTPAVTPGGTIRFFPQEMSVQGSGFKTDTFVTTIAIVPKADFQISTLDFVEYGDYRFEQGSDGNTAEFEVNSRLFISSFDGTYNIGADMLAADGAYTANEDTAFELWELSESYDISGYQGGFFLTIQNTLTISTLPTHNCNPDDAKGFWSALQSSYDHEGKDRHKNKKGKGHKHHGKGHGYGHYGKKGNDDFMYLQKKGIALHVNGTISEVPVPAAAWLFTSALAALFVARRRK